MNKKNVLVMLVLVLVLILGLSVEAGRVFRVENLRSQITGFATAIPPNTTVSGNAIEVQPDPSQSATFVVKEDGTVGVGVAVPLTKLDISGPQSTLFGQIRINTTQNGTGAGISFVGRQANGVDSFWDVLASSGNRLDFRENGTNGTTRMTVASGGNVGIGTTSPSEKLEVANGRLTFSGTTAATFGAFDIGPGAGFLNLLGGPSGTFIGTQAGSPSSAIVLLDNGNVGVGTGSPSSKLDVQGTVIAQGTVRAQAYTDPTGNVLVAKHNSVGNFVELGNPNINTIINGKVGVGTVSPESGLHVNTSSGNSLTLESAGNGFDRIKFKTFTEATNNSWTLRVARGGGGGFRLYENDEADTSLRFIVNDGGNVGIGTTNPSSNLHVYGASPKVSIQDNTGGGLLFLRASSGVEAQVGSENSVPLGLFSNNNRVASFSSNSDGTGKQVTLEGQVVASGLAGSGNAYLCVNSAGVLFRSTTACA